MRRRRPGGICTLVTALLCTQVAAQATPRVLRTPDGSQFLLHPSGGPPVVEWVVRTPAGPGEERDGEAGLAYAVARAAMAGTAGIGALDPEAERALLAQHDADETRAARLELAGEALPPDLAAARAGWPQALAKVADVLAWERAVRAAPASPTRLSQTPDAVLLHLTLAVEAIPRVADLLVARREGAVLRDLHREARAARAELAEVAAADPWAAARDEIRFLAYRGHPLGRPLLAPGPAAPLLRARAHEVFAATHHPARTRHVLVGGFDADAVAAVLERAFASTALPEVTRHEPPLRAAPGEVTGRIAGPFSGVALALRAPADAAAPALAVAAAWLGDGDASFLARSLRAGGVRVAEVRVTHPFPAASSAPFVLIEVRAESGEGRDAARRHALANGVEKALDAAAAATPTADELRRVQAHLEAAARRQAANPARLATRLALAWAEGVAAPPMGPGEPATAGEVTTALRGLLSRAHRVVVVQEPTP